MGETFFKSLDQNLARLVGNIGDWLSLHAFNIVVILLFAWAVRKFGAELLSRFFHQTIRSDLYPTAADREKRITTLNSLVGAFMRIAVYVVAFIMIVGEIGIDTGPLLASAGVLGVALGFGAQNLIKDFVSGMFLIIENQYRVGDVVQLGDVSGTVEAITIRTTVLRDLDGNVHHVPNGAIQITTNKTMDFGRINEDIVVDLDTDIEELAVIINDVGKELSELPGFKHKVTDPPHFSTVRGFNFGGIVVKIQGKTTPSEKWAVRSELYKRLKLAFKKHKIEVISQAPAVPTPAKK